MRLVAVTLAAWASSLAGYLGLGWALWHQRISPADLRATVFVSLIAVTVSVVAGYGPLMFALRRYAFFERRAWTFPAVGVLFGIIPLCVVGMLVGGRGSLLSPEATLFEFMFVVFGVVFGVGFWWVQVRQPS